MAYCRRGLVLAALLAVCSPALAGLCDLDPVPAATLLFPYLVFDYNQPLVGDNSTITIVNTEEAAQIVRVTLWSDTGEWLLIFNIVLSGYDMESFSLRDVLYHGELPDTGTAGGLVISGSVDALGPTPPDTLLPLPEGTDDLLSVCDPNDTGYPDFPPIPQNILDFFQGYLTYVQSFGAGGDLYHWDCVDANGDGYFADDVFHITPDDWWQERATGQPTWLWATVDVVANCDRTSPTDPAYWAQGLVRTDNVLTGDVVWTNDLRGTAEWDTAVHLQAAAGISEMLLDDPLGNPRTFYHVFSEGDDLREPLPTAWAFRYHGVGGGPLTTRLRVWKMPDDLVEVRPADDPHPLEGLAAEDCWAYTYYAWDEDENVVYSQGVPPLYQPNLLPLMVQEVAVDELDVPAGDGWMLFLWPGSNLLDSQRVYQVWMGVRHRLHGGDTAAAGGVVLGNGNCIGGGGS